MSANGRPMTPGGGSRPAPRAVQRLGDGALSVTASGVDEAHGLRQAVEDHLRAEAPAGTVEEVVTGFRSVTVVADPDALDLDALAVTVSSMPAPTARHDAPRSVSIPVTFDGPDLQDVAALAARHPEEVVALFEQATLRVAFLGFAPGFPYLVGLPPALAGIPRRATPRTGVAAGSVAVGGGFAGTYPAAMPGGWHLVGRTGTPLFDPDAAPYALLAPGDTVRFVRSDDEPVPPTPAREALRVEAGTHRRVTVEEPGVLTLVEDAGRVGVAALGVPRAGAADPDALELANRLVGNAPDAAVLECTVRGPTLRFDTAAHVAVVGNAELQLDGRAVPADVVVPVSPGQRLRVGTVSGDLRAYVGIDGGVATPPVLGSRSSDLLCGLGPGPLVAGDELGLGRPGRPRGRLDRGQPDATSRMLRVVPGPDPTTAATMRALLESPWAVGGDSDRVGTRLSGPTLSVAAGDVTSRAMVTGAVQVPPDGAPIVLGCDHATVGGYPVVATVVRADLGELGRCRPGDEVRFEPVDLDDATRLRAERRRRLERQVVGWFPVRSD
jgi:KipI family sensor histidine kinase inhibitor